MSPNTILSFRKNWWANFEKTCGETEWRRDKYRADERMEGQILFDKTLLFVSRGPTRETTKRNLRSNIAWQLLNIARELFVCNRHDTRRGMILQMLEVCDVRSEPPKTDEHIKVMEILYLDIWSMLLSTSTSYKLLKPFVLDTQWLVCASSNTVLEEHNLPPIMCWLFW